MFKQHFGSAKRPYFRDKGEWETLQFDLSGCKLEMTLPPHDYEFPEEDHGKRFNVFDQEMYNYKPSPSPRNLTPPKEGISRPGIRLRKWSSYGGGLNSSPIGLLQCNIVVCDISKMETNLNCFNKSHMEQLLLNGLYYSDGPGSGYSAHTAPLNWKIKNIGNSEWLCFESWQDGTENEASKFSVWFSTPIFEDKYILISFLALGSSPSKPSDNLMKLRIEKILPNTRVELSTEALKQKCEAEQKHPELKYSQNRKPEPWKYYDTCREGNPLAGEHETIYEGDYSPPPKLI